MRTLGRWTLAATLALGCESGSSVVQGVDAGGGADLTAPQDVRDAPEGRDLGAPSDVTDVPAPQDVPVDVGPARCVRAEDCAGHPDGPSCDATTGRCVACTPTNDRCPAGRYCAAGMNACAEGCRDDAACGGAGDGGASPQRCDPTSRRCVACVRDEHCPPGSLCVGNVCAAGCSVSQRCPAGETCCAGACVDTAASTAHCGACGAVCATPNASAACLNATCGVGRCAPGFADCDALGANGCEVDVTTSTTHCGACGRACATRANAAATCEAGQCRYACAAGFADCDGDPANGCEVDTRASAEHCGACNARCALANAAARCEMGRCAVASCAAPYADCDGNAPNGCEVDTRSAVAHCGACGRACAGAANAVGVCAAGTCALTCTASYADCDGDPANGCEVSVASAAAHCGGCGRACSAEGAEAVSCAASACRVDRCASGRGDCDGAAANGCEVTLATSLSHCGACGAACAPAGGTGRCEAGRCELAGCDSDRCDLDGSGANGCEAARRSDEFDGTALTGGWTQAVGNAGVYTVSAGRITFTDAPFASTPSLPSHSWIYDLSQDLGNQLQLPRAIGTRDFELSTAFSWESNVVELTLGYIALVDAQSRIVAYVGVHDGYTSGLGAGIATVANGTGYTAPLAAAGAHTAVIRRRAGVISITFDGQLRATGNSSADLRAVSLVTVAHRDNGRTYPFGTFSVDHLRLCD